MTIELDKAALFAAWQAFYATDDNTSFHEATENFLRAYLTAVRQPQRDAVVEAALDWQRSRTPSQEELRAWKGFKHALEILDATP